MSQQKTSKPWVGHTHDVEFVIPASLADCQARLASGLRYIPKHPRRFTGWVKGTEFSLAYRDRMRGDMRPYLNGTLQASQQGTCVQATFVPNPANVFFWNVALVIFAILLLPLPNFDFTKLLFMFSLFAFCAVVSWSVRRISHDETLREPLAAYLYEILMSEPIDPTLLMNTKI